MKTTDIAKGVAGVVDEYIDQKIRELSNRIRGPRGNADLVKWRTVLSSLIGRQEGGVLITLLTPYVELSKRCSTAGLQPLPESGFKLYLDGLCAAGLLRSVNYGDTKAPEYSLGHDALAPYLYRWHLQQVTTRFAGEKFRRRALALVLSVIATGIASYFLWFVPEKEKVALLTTREKDQFIGKVSNALELASVDDIQDAAGRLRPAIFALSQFEHGSPVDESLHNFTRTTIASLIERTPVSVGCADAIGVQDPATDNTAKVTSLVLLNETDTCFSQSHGAPSVSGTRVTTAEIRDDGELTPTSDLTFPIPEKKEDSNKGFPSVPFVGLLTGNSSPVLVSDRMISLRTVEGSFNSFPASKVFTDTTPRFSLFDISGGALWAIGPSSDSKAFVLQAAMLSEQGAQFQTASINHLPSSSIIWPVFSPWSSWLVDIDQQNNELRVRDRTGKTLGSWSLPNTEWADPVSFVFLRNQPIRPAGFVRNTSWVAIRTGPDSVRIYDVQQHSSGPVLTLDVPDDARGDPLRPSWFSRRPPIAGVLENGLITFAWATRRGIEVVRWKATSNEGTAEPPLVYSPDPGATITDVRFLSGNYLLVTVTEPGTFAIGFRLMDLNSARRAAIEKLTDSDLLRLACERLRANSNGSLEVSRMCSPSGG
jgi:hypothetical protein